MANSKISALTSATTPLAGTETLPIVQSSTTKQVTVANLTAGRSVSATSFVPSSSTIPANGLYLPAANAVGIATNTTNAIYIDASQNVGIGNTAPATKLTIGPAGSTGATLASTTYISDYSSTTQFRYLFNHTGAQLWGIGSDGVSAMIFGKASATTGAVASEYMRIEASGNLTVPSMYGTTVTTPRNVFIDSTGKMGGISSVRASKTNITPVTDSAWLYQISPVTFNYRKRDDDGNYLDEIEIEVQYGLIAEDVEAVKPEFCIYVEKEGNKILQGVHYDRMISPLIKALQEQKTFIASLTNRITALENK